MTGRSVLGRIGLGFLVVVGVFVAVVERQPAEFRVARSAVIGAPPAVVFAHVDDFQGWQAWSPWAKKDPTARNTYAGPPAGTGAVFSWAGNREVGAGRMTIVESRAPELIRIRLEFLAPFAATNSAEFAFAPDAGGTRVTWTMTGTNTFLTKAIHLVVDMDALVGADFEQGLANLKAVVEAPS